MFERTLSFLGSFCLHLLVLVLVLYWPAPDPGPLTPTGTIVSGLVSFNPLEGAAKNPTRQDTPAPQRGQQAQTPPPQNQPTTPETPTPKPPEKQPDPQPVKQPSKPPEDTATPIAEDPTKKPPQQNATAQAQPTQTPPAKNATAQTVPPVKNATAQTTPPAKNATTRPPRESVNDALADLQRQTGQQQGRGRSSGSGRGQDLSSALDDIAKEVGGSGSGTQGGGAGAPGGTGYGVAGAYSDSVVSRVRPNWSWPGRTDRRNYIAVVNIKIAPDGAIQSYRLTTPSGNDYFDSTVLRAIQATRDLEAPPDPRFQDMDVSFSSDALSK